MSAGKATGDRAKPESALSNPRWKKVPAVKSGRVVVIRDELLNTPGPPLVRGARELLRAIHPGFARAKFCGTSSSAWWRRAWRWASLRVKASPLMQA